MSCRRLDADTLADEKVEKALAGYERVRIDLGEAPQHKERFKVEGIPVVIVLGPDGKEVTRHTGFLDPDAMIAFLAGASGAKKAP